MKTAPPPKGARLTRAEDVNIGDRVMFINGQGYVVERIETNAIGGIWHHFNDDTGSNAWSRGEFCYVSVST